MNTNQNDSAIKAAMANELHAGHGGMEVVGEAAADGTVAVKCICGAGLTVTVATSPVETVAPPPRRRISVTDDDKKGGE